MSNPKIRLLSFDLDCPDPAELARFYGGALDLPVIYRSDDYVLLGREGAPGLGFLRQSGFRPPVWPDPAHSKQAHLELGVEDLDAAQERMLALGAVLPDFQPNPEAWRVLLDPAGHPFCLATHGV